MTDFDKILEEAEDATATREQLRHRVGVLRGQLRQARADATREPTNLETAQKQATLQNVAKHQAERAKGHLRDDAAMIVAIADLFRQARGAGAWSNQNPPGQDCASARLALTMVDGWLTGRPAELRELLDEVQTLLRDSEWVVDDCGWFCPTCLGRQEGTGHAADCRRVALLPRIEAAIASGMVPR